MKHRWAALGLVLALSALMTSTASAQVGSPQQGQRGPGPLGQNYPNPFNPETTIPFSVGYEGDPPQCTDPSRVRRVSLRIYNLLAQIVAVPILQGGGESRGNLENLQLQCGDYTASWTVPLSAHPGRSPRGSTCIGSRSMDDRTPGRCSSRSSPMKENAPRQRGAFAIRWASAGAARSASRCPGALLLDLLPDRDGAVGIIAKCASRAFEIFGLGVGLLAQYRGWMWR